MSADSGDPGWLRNRLKVSELPFREFMELALYNPRSGYYATSASPVGKTADYVTSPHLSPLFAFALGHLISEFVSRSGDGLSTVVDVGCGDGRLLLSLYGETSGLLGEHVRFFGVDRALERIDPAAKANSALQFRTSIDGVPRDGVHLILSNELFDAFPFARLVRRDEGLRELCVIERDGALDWSERDAPQEYVDYFASRAISLEVGQFADISLEWEGVYRQICERFERALIVTFDYGYPEKQLFHPRARRFGTAASYTRQRVTRDLLADPGQQDLTAHINFTDLIRAGESLGYVTLFFDRQARFLLLMGAAEHELLRAIEEVRPGTLAEGVELLQSREDAKRLILPDGIGEDIRVLVQGRGWSGPEWAFERKLY